MIHYLIDACVAADFYRPRSSFPAHEFATHRALKKRVTAQRLSGEAIIFIPAFCISEVFNTFAKWWIRQGSVFESREQYDNARRQFVSDLPVR